MSSRRMILFEKSLTRSVLTVGTLTIIVWYLYSALNSNHGNVLIVNKETWRIIKQINTGGEGTILKEKKQDFVEPSNQDQNRVAQVEIKLKSKAPLIIEEPVDTKLQWLLQTLKYPGHLKADPSASRYSSYSIMNGNVREPLERDEPVILVWWPPEYLINSKKNFLEREFQSVCGKCRLTTDRTTLSRSNVVLFDNIPSKQKLNDLPPENTRRPDQAYVLWHRETPAKTYHLKSGMVGRFDTMFNYTLSYRRDADIHWYLGNADFARRSLPVAFREKPHNFVDRILRSKRQLAVWVVSNCDNTKGAVARMQYAKELINAGLNLSKFGKCFDKMAPSKDFSDFLLPYKFYLAFENSWHCKDYLTEKFWRNGLMSNVVPVLWGPSKEDVKAVAPPHSYIHSEDFKSPRDLVRYLIYLDQNDAAYRKYFNWRLEPINFDLPINMIRTGYEPAMCKICRVLTENNGVMPYKVLPSSIDWVFIDGDDSKCLLYDLE